MKRIRPSIDIEPIHGNVLDQSVLSLGIVRKFKCVINALDNIMARSHVNRLCMSANVPLIETGTAGYLGQASFILKGTTECYDCTQRKDDRNKTYPACTIRNTPSEPPHCVIWGKYLFSQLFGEADPDAEVSPDPDDPELRKENESSENNNSGKDKISTRKWAELIDYDPEALLKKFFNEDVQYLLRLDSLWKKRKPPVPLDCSSSFIEWAPKDVQERDHEVWAVDQCMTMFERAVTKLKGRMGQEGPLSFDKDDDLAIDFVNAAANLRCAVFHIKGLTRFSTKSIAGNIIAAIATTNSVIAGCAVIKAVLNVLSKEHSKAVVTNDIQQVMLRRNPVLTGRAKNRFQSVFVTGKVEAPNSSCYVCSPESSNSRIIEICFDFGEKSGTLKSIREKLLQKKLHFSNPEMVTSEGKLLISADEEDNSEKVMSSTLKDMGFPLSGITALVEDIAQNISLSLAFTHVDGVSFDDALETLSGAQVPVSPPSTENRPKSRKRHLSGAGNGDGEGEPLKKVANGNGHVTNGTANGSSNGVSNTDITSKLAPEVNGSNGTHNNDQKNVIMDADDDDCVLLL